MIDTLYDTYKCWSETGSIYIYSDPHFNDEEMKHLRKNYIGDEEQIKKINSVVHKNDALIILGDIGDETFIPKLKAGFKVLVKGNHDKGNSCYKKSYINLTYNEKDCDNIKELRKELTKKYPNSDITIIETSRYSGNHYPEFSVLIDDRMFDEVYEGPLFISDKILLSHEPIDLPFVLNIHGHDHANWHGDDDNHINCCAELIDYTPINLKTVINSGMLKNIPSIHRMAIDIQSHRQTNQGKESHT